MIEYPSPNFDARPTAIDMLLLHYTGMPTGEEALARLVDPEAKVSAHYLIEEDGRVFRLMAEDKRAWHAGVACWAGARDINACSIGIELVNPGHEWGLRPYPLAQMAALAKLAGDIVARYDIAPGRVLGHSDVAPARKQDPGELFDWAWLAGQGVGLWPRSFSAGKAVDPDDNAAVRALQQDLAQFGYGLDESGVFDDVTQTVVAAFQRHFRPARIDGRGDAETVGRLAAVLAMV